ncbi:MAG: CehA/McbA family metallohydrolase [Gemmatimonadaceae bacterium]
MKPRFLILLLIPPLWIGASALEAAHLRASQGTSRWYKGNTHTHTLNSDGDSSPDDVVRWYREHGYNFLVLTDHNFLTSVDGLNALNGADERFLVVRGEEVTDRFDSKPIHVNGLGVSRLVSPQSGSSVVETVQRNVDAIRAAEGVPHINHPNFGWAITADEIARVKNNRLFEVYNGHPTVNNAGGGGVLGLEAAWDTILSRGVLIYGIAVDDAHTFKQPWNADVAKPGQGWIYVRAPRLDAQALLQAIERGDFYSSTGVELSDYRASARSVAVTVREKPWAKYRIQFIGRGGRVLQENVASPATYEIKGTEGYVRAKIIESSGRVAWTQPIVIDPR